MTEEKPLLCRYCGSDKLRKIGDTWDTPIGGKYSNEITVTTFQRVKCENCKRQYNHATKKVLQQKKEEPR